MIPLLLPAPAPPISNPSVWLTPAELKWYTKSVTGSTTQKSEPFVVMPCGSSEPATKALNPPVWLTPAELRWYTK